ncbi:hypothetical protein [Drosophila suzukii associated hytrosavirus 1]|nr:hypothetical protein [Drosophila suzukii associated hytrosavirus 1]
MSDLCTINLNRFHRLSLWCRDCDSYWQLPNYLVVLHGTYDRERIKRLLKINLYLYNRLLNLDIEQCFGSYYDFDTELRSVLYEIRQKLHDNSNDVKILDVDVLAVLEENMPAVVDFILQMRSSFDSMALRLRENMPKNFIGKLNVLKKNILKSLDSDNVKCVLDNLMDLNIAGLDLLVQCVGIIFNCFYVLSVDIVEPKNKTPGVIYCQDPAIIIERLANISAQNFFYKYKRRWLMFYREVLVDCNSVFDDIEKYKVLRQCGNVETIENALYEVLIAKNTELMKQLTILKHVDRYPKTTKDIYEWWSGRSKEQLQRIYNQLDDSLGMDKKSALLPFILTHNQPAKDRLYHELLNVLHMFYHIKPELSNALTFILKIYPEVFEQIYFPDRERYISMNTQEIEETETSSKKDVLDNIRDKNTLRKCENARCQARNKGKNVVWNLNTFEVGKHSMNTIIKELCKNPRIFEEIYAYANKNLHIALNSNAIVKKNKIMYS